MLDQESELIKSQFPEIFRETRPSTDVGWNLLLSTLCKKLQFLSDQYGVQVVADQVKEKFGTLRFYFHIEEKKKTLIQKVWGSVKTFLRIETKDKTRELIERIIHDLIAHAEIGSGQVCEKCGKYGKGCSVNGWMLTLCKSCFEKKTAVRKEEKK